MHRSILGLEIHLLDEEVRMRLGEFVTRRVELLTLLLFHPHHGRHCTLQLRYIARVEQDLSRWTTVSVVSD
jgi:hypothetical protein